MKGVCEACGHAADDLQEHPAGSGALWCPSLQRCDYNQNIGWINADIQAGINAAMNDWQGER